MNKWIDQYAGSRFVRVFRWGFYLLMALSIGMVWIEGYQQSQKSYARLKWIPYFIGTTRNFALYLLERHRREVESW
jgi:hypothetical protein